jgi:TorA maturation chaperone TorD
VSSAVVDRAAVPAQAARLLAAWWSRPTADELERWAHSWPAAYATAELLELCVDTVDELRAAAEEAPATELLEEYERLLVGPGRVSCAPYESLWRDDQPRREQGRLMGSCAADVVRIYRDLGLRLHPGAHELPDHLVVEWEALAYAFEHEAAASSSELVQTHLALWTTPFCAAVARETGQPYYAALARLTPEWTTALAA